jgi:serine phosphatase RsbU (regulator of sigma subunit)
VEGHVDTGDTIFFLTDGVFEVFDAEGEEFGEKQFAQAIQNLGDQPLKTKMDALIESARNFSATREFDDDVCFIGMEILQVAKAVGMVG